MKLPSYLLSLSVLSISIAVQGQAPAQAPGSPPAVPVAVGIGNLSLQNASLVQVIDQLARQLHINYIIDPAVKGSVYLNTYGSTENMDARNLLELILRINGAGSIRRAALSKSDINAGIGDPEGTEAFLNTSLDLLRHLHPLRGKSLCLF